MNMSVEFYRNYFRNTLLLHGDAVERIGCLHRLLAVRHHDELGIIAHLLQMNR